ncbi:MAG TPA: DUF4058 family protein [Gemmataceae bacterium]|nr:DUF4058 family protein [Gemmataceae bacterium]
MMKPSCGDNEKEQAMPLLDHFHPPLSERRHWESFHASWANEIMAALNEGGLPEGYFAETQVHFGSRIEVDVATLQERQAVPPSQANGGVAVEPWAATQVLFMPAVFPDEIEVQIIHNSGGPTLVGAIELVSPRNKDRPEARRAFAAKCLAYLQSGVGLLIVDIVTERHQNLHDELINLCQQDAGYRFSSPPPSLYTVAYRPLRTEAEGDQIELRPAPLQLGGALPTMPLALRGGPIISVELERTYTMARQRSLL